MPLSCRRSTLLGKSIYGEGRRRRRERGGRGKREEEEGKGRRGL